MKWSRSKRALAFLLAMLLLALFVIRPSVGGLRKRIVSSVSFALGRKVEISAARLRLFPQPGFDLENFVVYDDPGISLEPILRSGQVTATVGIMPLLRGRLEISRLTLRDPSLNLVRSSAGHWNLEYLLEKSSRTPVAPTGKPASEPRPAFPYVDASGGRINFKFGMEKKRFALTDADFALFQDSENSWGVRLEAKPVRTDSNFSDTGLLKITGSWQRAVPLRDTPLRFNVRWEQAQLGQASKLVYGNDKGWRGAVSFIAELSGTPGNLSVITQATVEDFRRYDVVAGDPVRLRVQCGGSYSSATQTLSSLICECPVGNGALTLHGSGTVSRSPAFQLAVFAQDVPLQSVIALARHSKKDVPADLLASGTLAGSMKIQRKINGAGAPITWEGAWDTSEFRLGSQAATTQLLLPRIHFSISSETHTASGSDLQKDSRKHRRVVREDPKLANDWSKGTRVDISPFSVALGEPSPAIVSGWFSRLGYDLTIAGKAQLRRLLRSAKILGIPAPQLEADGRAEFKLQIAETWAGFKAARVTGSAELDSVRANVAGLSDSLQIDFAKIVLNPETASVEDLRASLGGIEWHGSLILPRPCGVMGTCPIEMNLHTDEITTAGLTEIFRPGNQAPWYRFLMASRKNYLMSLRASGKLSADRLLIQKLPAAQFSATYELDRGVLHLTNVRAAVLGGNHGGEWTLDFKARPPAYTGTGSFQRIALGQLAGAMRDTWITGTASATYNVAAFGSSQDEIFGSATGALKIDARDGLLPHIVLTNFAGPLHLHHFEGNLLFQHKEFEFVDSRIEANGSRFRVTGTASLGRTLNLTLDTIEGNATRRFSITGTIAQPLVSANPISETRAALKR